MRKGNYKPMAFGPIGRNFKARYPFAGTYDKKWLENVAPFLPADFNPPWFTSRRSLMARCRYIKGA